MRPILLLFLLLCGCGGDAAAPAGDDSPGTGDTAAVRFEDYFSRLELLDAGTGLPGLHDDGKGFRFSRKAALQVSATAHRAVTIRLVVRSRTSGQAHLGIAPTLAPGENLLELGRFPGDLYALEVLVHETRVKLIPFAAE